MAAADPQPLGDVLGAPQSGRGDAVELLLRGQPNVSAGSAPTLAPPALAPYLAEWKRKVERVGTLNFPSAARRAGLSGSPVVEVEIASDGQLRQARVRRSSGYGAIDEAALTILHLAARSIPFPLTLPRNTRACALPISGTSLPGTLPVALRLHRAGPVAALPRLLPR